MGYAARSGAASSRGLTSPTARASWTHMPTKALKALAVGGLLPTRSRGASPVLAGLVPAIHAAPPQRRVHAAPRGRDGLRNNAFLPPPPLAVALCTETRGQPGQAGHDASGPSRAATTCGISVANS